MLWRNHRSKIIFPFGKHAYFTLLIFCLLYTSAKDTKIATATVKDGKIIIKGVKAGSTSVTVTDKNKKTGTISITVK